MKSEESLGSEGSRGVGWGGWELVVGIGSCENLSTVSSSLAYWPMALNMLVLGWPVVRCVCVCVCVCAGRMGNPRAALELIIKKLQDVDMVTECSASCFCDQAYPHQTVFCDKSISIVTTLCYYVHSYF